jgi:hypothetical protein
MAGIPIYAGTYAARALASGASATAGLAAFRRAGGGIRAQTWYRLYGQAEFAGIARNTEAGAALNRIPERSSLPVVTTRSKTGIQQRVRVFGTTPEGTIDSRVVTIRTQNGISRQNAIRRAIDAVAASDSYPLRPVSGVHISAFQEVPGDTGGYDSGPGALPGGGSDLA